MNGLAGTLLLGGLGIARTMEMHCDYKADIIPVDFVANSLIVVGYNTAVHPEQRKQVVHITSGEGNPIKWGQILDFARVSALANPSIKQIRPIAKNPISSHGLMGKANFLFTKFFSHFVFALLFDLMLVVMRRKPIMMKVTRKMHKAFDVLAHFTNREWSFKYKNYPLIHKQLSDQDRALFFSDVEKINWLAYCDSLYMGSRRYLLNEDDSTIPDGKKRQKMLAYVFGTLNAIIYGALALTAYVIILKVTGGPKLV